MTTPTLASCRLCQGTLRERELELRVCSVCESYAEQMGVRDPRALQAMIAELANDPIFSKSSTH